MKEELEVYIEIQGGMHYVIKKSRGVKVTVMDLDARSNSEVLEVADQVLPGPDWKASPISVNLVDDLGAELEVHPDNST